MRLLNVKVLGCQAKVADASNTKSAYALDGVLAIEGTDNTAETWATNGYILSRVIHKCESAEFFPIFPAGSPQNGKSNAVLPAHHLRQLLRQAPKESTTRPILTRVLLSHGQESSTVRSTDLNVWNDASLQHLKRPMPPLEKMQEYFQPTDIAWVRLDARKMRSICELLIAAADENGDEKAYFELGMGIDDASPVHFRAEGPTVDVRACLSTMTREEEYVQESTNTI